MGPDKYFNVKLWLARMNAEGFVDGKANKIGEEIVVWCPSELCNPCKGAEIRFPEKVHAVAALIRCDRCHTTFTSVVPHGLMPKITGGKVVRSYLGDLEIHRN